MSLQVDGFTNFCFAFIYSSFDQPFQEIFRRECASSSKIDGQGESINLARNIRQFVVHLIYLQIDKRIEKIFRF